MLIVGAGGFAKDLFETFHERNEINDLVFFDETITSNKKLFNFFNILKSEDEVIQHFKTYDFLR